jgi:hypothetical protein
MGRGPSLCLGRPTGSGTRDKEPKAGQQNPDILMSSQLWRKWALLHYRPQYQALMPTLRVSRRARWSAKEGAGEGCAGIGRRALPLFPCASLQMGHGRDASQPQILSMVIPEVFTCQLDRPTFSQHRRLAFPRPFGAPPSCALFFWDCLLWRRSGNIRIGIAASNALSYSSATAEPPC